MNIGLENENLFNGYLESFDGSWLQTSADR
jgi:hypothetical protein